MLIVVAALLAGGAVLLFGIGPGHGRPGLVGGVPIGGGLGRRGPGRASAGPTGAAPVGGRSAPASAPDQWPGWAPWAASLIAGAAVWGLVGGPWGVVGGALVALAAPHLLAKLEPRSLRRERMALVAAAPLVADLMAASLAAGTPLDRALPVIARALGGPTEVVLDRVSARIRLGEPAEVAWARVADVPGLGGIARTVARSSRSGAPLAGMLAATAVDLRAESTAAGLAEVRATSVRAVLPLGLCLLPAFGLLGILPVVAGLIPSL